MKKISRFSDYISVDETTEYMHVEIPTSFSKVNLIVILITLYFLYLKVLDNLLASWQACFYPLFILLSVRFLYTFYDIIRENKLKEVLSHFYGTEDDVIVKLENLILLSNLFNLIHYFLCGVICLFFAEFMDSKQDDYIFYFMNVLIGMVISQLLFSFITTSSYFDLKKTNITKDVEANGNQNTNDDSYFAFFTSLIAPILTYFSNMMIICSANSGVCTQFYLSTLTSLLGAFGISVSHISTYLFPITIIMLIISNISLYIKRKKLTYPPFLLGLFSTLLIIISKLFEESFWWMNYLGSVLMIIAAIWNVKLNRFFGIPRRKK